MNNTVVIIKLSIARGTRTAQQSEVEVMVYTPEEVDEWSQVPQAFVTTAVREGTTIYERRG